MQPLLCIHAFLGLALATPTKNYNATTSPRVTNIHVSTLSSTNTSSNTPSSSHCQILIENDPWLLSNITYFVPTIPSQNHTTNSTSSPPSISFHFRDPNRGLELETYCYRTLLLPLKRGGGVDDPGTRSYYPCVDGRVRFAYAAGEGGGGEAGGELKVGRVHRDD
ncbi:hypothetical protein D0862_15002, partial [Hortaea werneckii]